MANGASVPKSPWHMANKPACTRGGPADRQVGTHTKHAHYFCSAPRSCRQQQLKVNTKHKLEMKSFCLVTGNHVSPIHLVKDDIAEEKLCFTHETNRYNHNQFSLKHVNI